MKKAVSLIIAAVMLVNPFSVFSDSSESENMQRVLLLVKEKIEVPENLSEFSSRILTRENEKSYHFEWTDTESSQMLSISCDDKGRINSYDNYSFEAENKKLSSVSKKEIEAFAQTFLEKTLPEAFENEKDKLIYDESSYNASGALRYSLEFKRYRNSLFVKDNTANVSVCIKNDKLYVKNMYVNFSYDAEFEDDGEIIENYTEKYKEAFPLELIYADEYTYNAKKGKSDKETKLIYRIKDNNTGFISLTNGELIEEDRNDSVYREESEVMDSMAYGSNSSQKTMLTEKERAEIGTVKGLLSVLEIEKRLKVLPYLEFSKELKNTGSYLTKNDSEEYFYRLSYNSENKDKYRYFNVLVNAHNGKIQNISNNFSYDSAIDKTLTEKEKSDADKKILSFINKVSEKEFKECKEKSTENYSKSIYKTYVRLVNGIEYIDNTINITFNAEHSIVENYSLNFSESSFASPDEAILIDTAYEKILEYSPIEKMYILNDGKYKKAATLEKKFIRLDAQKGEILGKAENENKNYSYSDIKGHWVEDAAIKLSEIQLGLGNGILEAEKAITQKELLRFFASGMINKYYDTYRDEELYNMLIEEKIIEESEKSPEAEVVREKAFIYMIRFAGLERVAKLDGIYKTSFKDENLLENSSVGYAAILSGLNVICGDGGYLRPQDNLSRAEAIMMLYKYLLN